MPHRWSALSVTVALLAWAPPAAPAESPEPGRWWPPVDGPVVRRFEPPARPFGPHHLGLDFAAPPGTPVRAAGDGMVAFAGRTGHAWAVTVAHPGARRTTYAYLAGVRVSPGWPVRRGDVVGLSGGRGPGHQPGVVHFGYRVGARPQDPAPLFDPPPARFSLVPLDRPACQASTLGRNPTPPGRESTRPHSNGVRP